METNNDYTTKDEQCKINYMLGYLRGLINANCSFDAEEFSNAIEPVIEDLYEILKTYELPM